MGNGGSLPAHLPSSMAMDDLWYKEFCQAISLAVTQAVSLAVTQAVESALAPELAKMAKSKSAKAADDRRCQEAAAEALAA